MNKKYILYGIVLVLIGVAIGYIIPKNSVIKVGGVSAAGTIQSSPQIYQVSFNASTTATTTAGTGIYSAIVAPNNSNDREITSSEVSCTGVAKETQTNFFQIQAATSTISTTSSSFYLVNLTVGTTTASSYNASSTVTSGSSIDGSYFVWPAGVNLIIATTATDTAVCTLRIPYIQL